MTIASEMHSNSVMSRFQFSTGDLLKNFHLTRSQAFVAHVLGRVIGDLGRDALLTGVYLSDYGHKIVGRHA